MEAEGVVTSSGSTLVVKTRSADVTVNTDAHTVVRKDGRMITVADIMVGDQVEAKGTRVDDHTLLATRIDVHGNKERD
jgi:uncharacterized protein DUF5666